MLLFRIYKGEGMIILLWVLYPCASCVEICICPQLNCADLCPSPHILDPGYGLLIRDFYEHLRNLMGRTSNIRIRFIDTTNDHSYEPEIALPAFLDRDIEFVSTNLDMSPRSVVFTYSKKENYLNTKLVFTNLSIIFKNTDDNINAVDLRIMNFVVSNDMYNFTTFKLEPLVGVSYKLYTEYLDANIADLTSLSHIEIISTNGTANLLVDSEISSTIFVTDNHLNCSWLDKNLGITYPTGCSIKITGKDKSSKLYLYANSSLTASQSSKICIDSLFYIALSGTWPDTELYTISCSSLNLYVDMEYVPFQIIAKSVSLMVNQSSTFLKPIISLNTYLINNDDFSCYNITIYKHEKGRIISRSDKLNIHIKDLILDDKDVGKDFPVEIALSDNNISSFIIDRIEPSWEKMTNLIIYSTISQNRKDDQLSYILDNPITVLTIPINSKVDASYTCSFSLESPEVSMFIHGFSNYVNCLNLNTIKDKDAFKIQIQGNQPSKIPVKLCHGSGCVSKYGIEIDQNCLNQLGSCPQLISTVDTYVVTVMSPSYTKFDINLTNLTGTNFSFSFIDKTANSKKVVHSFMFPEDSTAILNISIDNFYLDTGIDYIAESVNFYNIEKYSTTCPNFDNVTNVFVDQFSFDYLCIGPEKVKNLIIDLTEPEDFETPVLKVYNDNMFQLITVIKEWDFDAKEIDNLTFYASFIALECLISTPQNLKGFNIIIVESFSLTFDGDWGILTGITDGGLNIEGNPLIAFTVIFSVGFWQKDIHFHPNGGTIFYATDYGIPAKYCICRNETDLENCPQETINILIDDFNKITEMKNRSYSLKFTGFDAIEDAAKIDLNLFNCKQLQLSPVDENNPQYLVFSATQTTSQVTKIIIDRMMLTASDAKKLEVSYLDTTKTVFDSTFNETELYTDTLRFSFSNAVKFKRIECNNFLQLIDKVPKENTTIFFYGLESENRMSCNIGSDANVTFHDDSIQIENIIINFAEPSKTNVMFNTEAGFVVSITSSYEYNKTLNEIKINAAKGGSIKMLGDFPHTKLFTVVSAYHFKLFIDSIVPIDIIDPVQITVFAESNKCGIDGTVRIDRFLSMYRNMFEVENNLDCRVEFYIKEFVVDRTIQYSVATLLNYTINMNISTLKTLGTKNISVIMCNTLEKKGCSSINIMNISNYIKSNDVMFIQPKITGPLELESEYAIIQSRIMILNCPLNYNSLIQPSIVFYNEAGDTTHGFGTHWNCLELVVEENERCNIYLNVKTRPSKIPYIIEYIKDPREKRNNSEQVLDDFSGFAGKIPKVIESVVLLISDDPNGDSFIKLSDIPQDRSIIDFTIDAVELVGKEIHFDTSPKIKILQLFGVIFTSNNQIFNNLDVLNFTECQFGQNSVSIGSDINLISIDINSYINLVSSNSSYNRIENQVLLRQTNIITFTRRGWIVQEDVYTPPLKIEKDSFKSIEFDSRTDVQLLLEEPNVMHSVVGVKIHLHSFLNSHYQMKCYASLGEGWNKIISNEGLWIDAKIDEISIATVSYPFPYITDLPIGRLVTFMSRKRDTKFVLKDEIIFNETACFDLQDSTQSTNNRVIYGNAISINKNTSIYLYGTGALIHANSLTCINDTVGSIGLIRIMESFVLEPCVNLTIGLANVTSRLTIEFHWRLNFIPLIRLTQVDGIPGKIKIILDDENPDPESYNNFLFRYNFVLIKPETHDFVCQNWTSPIEFQSNSPYFQTISGNQTVVKVFCDHENNLMMRGISEIPTVEKPPDVPADEKQKLLGPTLIAVIAISIFLVACIIVGFSVYCYTRKRYDVSVSEKIVFKGIRTRSSQDME